ncbi:LysE family translocator [Hoeflea olei]|uniref:Lysine transporter LysE n=1 Tax=Hoeflea olei TaxID=1480615 RepID=A0A1C1YZP4_9HYPH|nr:LysE family translocator [Hoeflea olei]OCW59024.1 lysine transporter LysE [Hoeflea olei]
MSPEFLLTALIVVLAPGTGVLYTVSTGLGRGRLPSLAAAFGCTLGILPHLMASALGLAAILHTSALLFHGLKYLGAAYLAYLAIQTLRDKGPIRFDGAEAAPKSHGRIAVTGFLINVLNPKLSVFFLAFLPQFIPAEAGGKLAMMLELGFVFMAMTFAVFVLYGLFAAQLRRAVLASERAMTAIRRVSALAFGGLAVKLALAER